MSWLNTNRSLTSRRLTAFNNNVVLSAEAVDNIANNFDGIFDNFTKFVETISSIRLYPILMKVDDGDNPNTHSLNTVKGTVLNVSAKPFNPINSYRSLGEYFISNKYNNFADYKGYTKIQLFLPFLGYVDVDVNECMGKYLQLRLYIDFFTGKGAYIIGVSDNSITHAETSFVTPDEDYDVRVISTFETDLGIEIPLGSSNAGDIKRNLLLGAVKTAAAAGAAIYTGNLPPPVTMEYTTKTLDIQGRGTEKGSRMKQIRSGTITDRNYIKTTKPYNKSKPVSEVIDGSIEVLNRSYNGGNADRVNDAGLLVSMSLNPHIVIYRPRMLPTNYDYDFLYGKPVGAALPLNEVAGYTELNSVHIEGSAFAQTTAEEMSELEAILTSPNGIILPGEIRTLFKFKVAGKEFATIPNKTWGEFINSEYNINNTFSLLTDTVVYNPTNTYIKDELNNHINKSFTINKSIYYI